MRLQEIMNKTVDHFKAKGIPSARFEAEQLISHALGWPRLDLYLKFENILSEEQVSRCRELVMRRTKGEPSAYIQGSRGFYKAEFIVRPGVLIPRPETELLVEHVVAWVKAKKLDEANTEVKILEFGPGTGCIGLSLLQEVRAGTLTVIEISEDALGVFKENMTALNLTERVTAIAGDACLRDTSAKVMAVDIVVANPPYIDKADILGPGVREFEPAVALFSPDDGMFHIKAWAKVAVEKLKPGGLCIFEIGSKQGDKVRSFFEGFESLSDVKILKDYASLDRFVCATRN